MKSRASWALPRSTINKLPRVPIADNIPGGDMPKFRNLWEHIRTRMPRKGRGKAKTLDPLSLPVELQTALEALYGHYAKTYDLLQQDEAHIVNVSSSAGFTGMKWQSSYASTKFAVTGLSESLFVELAGTNVGISCIHPGAVATRILDSARMATDRREKMLKTFKYATPPESAARKIARAIEKKRFKVVLCVDAHVLYFFKRLAPVGLLKLMRLASARATT